MALEILLFRSLFRNTKSEDSARPPTHLRREQIPLACGAGISLVFSVIFLPRGPCRFFTEPVPRAVLAIERVDSFFQVGAPVLYVTDVIIVAALLYLLLRRLADPQVRYISLLADYFALFLILGLAVSGIWMRYFTRVDIVAIRQLAIGLVTFSPVVPKEVGHCFLCTCFC